MRATWLSGYTTALHLNFGLDSFTSGQRVRLLRGAGPRLLGPPQVFFQCQTPPGVGEMLARASSVAPAFCTALTAVPRLAGRFEMGWSVKRGARRELGVGHGEGNRAGAHRQAAGLVSWESKHEAREKAQGFKGGKERLKGKQKN